MPGRPAWLCLAAVPACLLAACTSTHSATGQHASSQATTQAPQRAEDEAMATARSRIGRSAGGRALWVYRQGDPDAVESILIVGCVHGDEPAGIAVARLVIASRPPADASVWVIPSLNPDGVAAGTRQNGAGVDLNRNFPYRWRPLGGRGSRYYAGPAPLSAPESRAAVRLIERLRPQISIWFHQPYGVVDQSGGDVRIERRFAQLIGLPLRLLARYPGSITGWENHRLPGSTAFVVELPPGAPTVAAARRYADAVVDLTNAV